MNTLRSYEWSTQLYTYLVSPLHPELELLMEGLQTLDLAITEIGTSHGTLSVFDWYMETTAVSPGILSGGLLWSTYYTAMEYLGIPKT